jgi:glycosyltransferase involved in cell wall biosynthesis
LKKFLYLINGGVVVDVELHTFTFNEEYMLPKLVKWYRKRLPNIRIVVHDNESTDRTLEIARDLGCEVIPFGTKGRLRNKTLMDLKNSSWKGSKADFVIVADVDEFIDVSEDFLARTDATVIRGVGINMIGNSQEIEKISLGVLSSNYDKMLCFKPAAIRAMNYKPGAHSAQPEGEVKLGHAPLYHYKWISPEYVIMRTKLVQPRRSQQDKRLGWGVHYEMTEETIRKIHSQALAKAVSVYPAW